MDCDAGLQTVVTHLRRPRVEDLPGHGLERRRFARADLSLAAWVSVDEQSVGAHCLNLSAGGALLRLDEPRELPETFLLHLVMPALGDLPVPVIARRIEVAGRRVRLAFDPLPAALAKAIATQLLTNGRRSGQGFLN